MKEPEKRPEKPCTEQAITDTLKENFMPYAMSVIVSRAIPEIDGFKPAHRKLLYTMYTMGLLKGNRTKSANIVGSTMKLNPHGDAAIYETMVRLTRGHDALLHPFVDSKGNFGKHSSRDTAYAAPRYTEAKLDSFCAEIFADIDKDTVDMVDNYDGTLKEPALLPVTFPNVIVSPNQGMAVGMTTNIASFNLAEVCNTAAELIKNPDHDLFLTLTAPDFTTGGDLIYDRNALETIYNTGMGSFKLRGRHRYDKKSNCLEIYEIPYTTTTEAIIDKVVELAKGGKIKEISDVRDETDINGLKIAIDLKRGADPEKVAQMIYKMTTLEDSFACNFNVLVGGLPRVMGIREILTEWTAFRVECIRRSTYYAVQKKGDYLHLLRGLEKILLDIDKAIRIVRETEEEADVIPNLMIGFSIDQVQAEFVAEIKLRNLNREYILKKTKEIESLEEELADLNDLLAKPKRINQLIIKQLQGIAKKYGQPRRTKILYPDDVPVYTESEEIEDYPVTFFVTESGYCKKITPQSLRMYSEQKLKEGDSIRQTVESSNAAELIFFTDKQQAYKIKAHELDDTKASAYGEYIPQRLGLDEDEHIVYTVITTDFVGSLLVFFQNGKVARVAINAYETKLNRKKLVNAYSAAAPLCSMHAIREETDFLLIASNGRRMVFNTALIGEKTTKNTAGVNVMTLKAKSVLAEAAPYVSGTLVRPEAYRVKTVPAAGCFLKEEDKQVGLFTTEE